MTSSMYSDGSNVFKRTYFSRDLGGNAERMGRRGLYRVVGSEHPAQHHPQDENYDPSDDFSPRKFVHEHRRLPPTGKSQARTRGPQIIGDGGSENGNPRPRSPVKGGAGGFGSPLLSSSRPRLTANSLQRLESGETLAVDLADTLLSPYKLDHINNYLSNTGLPSSDDFDDLLSVKSFDAGLFVPVTLPAPKPKPAELLPGDVVVDTDIVDWCQVPLSASSSKTLRIRNLGNARGAVSLKIRQLSGNGYSHSLFLELGDI